MAQRIKIAGGRFVLVDERDEEFVRSVSWHAHQSKSHIYAVNRQHGKMHRTFFDVSPTEIVDHKNGRTLDNRRSNLRVVTKTQNNRNTVRRNDSQWLYKGIEATRSGWRASIQVDGRRIRTPSYGTQRAAAQAYDDMARELFGEFAKLNFPKRYA